MKRLAQAFSMSLLALALAACGGSVADPAGGSPPDLVKTTLRAGDGAVARSGQTVRVHYTGWLYDEREPGRKGESFDSSHTRGEPFAFALGAGRVIRGWDEGVAGMRVGELCELAIPADLAYGQRGAGGVIPGNQPLLFEVELLSIDGEDSR